MTDCGTRGSFSLGRRRGEQQTWTRPLNSVSSLLVHTRLCLCL